MTLYLNLLRTRPNFRYLWIAQVISLGGDWFNAIATVILVQQYTNSATAVSGLFVARALPPFVLGPVAGVVADRFSRRTVMIATNWLRMIIVLGFLLVDSPSEVWLLYALTILQFSISAFFEPAYAAIVPNLVEGEELLAANTLGNITWSAMLTLGAALGGVTAAVVGVQAALVIDALTFAVAALLMAQVHAPALPVREHHQTNGWQEFRAGLNFLLHRPRLGAVALVKGMGQIGNVDIIAALYADHIFRIGDNAGFTYGLMMATHGIGAVLGPLLANRLGSDALPYLKRAIWVGFGSYVVAWLIIGAAPWLAIALLGSLLRGMGGSINWTYSSVILQRETPDQMMGRVFGLDFAFFTLMMAISVWLTGAAVDQFDLTPRGMVYWLALLSVGPFLLWSAYLRSENSPHPKSLSLMERDLKPPSP